MLCIQNWQLKIMGKVHGDYFWWIFEIFKQLDSPSGLVCQNQCECRFLIANKEDGTVPSKTVIQ